MSPGKYNSLNKVYKMSIFCNNIDTSVCHCFTFNILLKCSKNKNIFSKILARVKKNSAKEIL